METEMLIFWDVIICLSVHETHFRKMFRFRHEVEQDVSKGRRNVKNVIVVKKLQMAEIKFLLTLFTKVMCCEFQHFRQYIGP